MRYFSTLQKQNKKRITKIQHFYSVFQGFSKATFADGGSILSSS
jgi:hypothetical protein